MTDRNADPDAALGDVRQTHLADYSASARRRRRAAMQRARDSWRSLAPRSRPRPVATTPAREVAVHE